MSDSEAMAGQLSKDGFHIVQRAEDAELVVVNSCTVKSPSVKHMREFLEEQKGKKIVVGGCVAQADPTSLQEYSLVGTKQIHNITQVVEETLSGNVVKLLVPDHEAPRLQMPHLRKNPIVEIIPILDGCQGVCTFCKTRLARGYLKSHSVQQILAKAKKAIESGAKEIWLTSEDNGCWGKDIGSSLPALLGDVLSLEGDFRVRLGMANPNHTIKMMPELAECFLHPKMFRFLHIPLQAGNNRVLQVMKREYTAGEFLSIVDYFRKSVPDVTLATDIIVGFPGETDEEFLDTTKVLRTAMPDITNISRYFPMSKTPAARMENQVHGRVKKERSRQVTELYERIGQLRNERWIGWVGEVVIDEEGKDGTSLGRNFAYKQIVVDGSYKLGQKLSLKVRSCTPWYLKGELSPSEVTQNLLINSRLHKQL